MFGQKKKAPEAQIETNLNRVVTPMLDMTFQILFFLIMNFRLPTPEGQVDLFLPQEDTGAPSMASTDNLDKKDEDEYALRVNIYGQPGDNQGTIAALTWTPKKMPTETINPDPNSANDKDEYYQKLDPILYGLVRHLKQYQPKEGGKQPVIKIECDKKLRYSELLRIMDVCRKMKFQNVGVMPIPKAN